MKATQHLHEAGQSLWLRPRCMPSLRTARLARVLPVAGIAAHLQHEGAEAFVKSWNDLLVCIAERSATLKRTG